MAEHEGQTDSNHQVTLSSTIERVQWADLRAAPGGTVGLEITTRYVSHGSTLQIKLTDHKGKTHGTFQDEIYNNHLSADIQVPDDAEDALYATVKLPKHGLRQKSPALVLTNAAELKNASWSQDKVRRGDVLTLSADVHGVADGTEAVIDILEHDEKGAHDPITQFTTQVEKEKVEATWAFEFHEDTDNVPTDAESEDGYHWPEYFFRVRVRSRQVSSGPIRFHDHLRMVRTDCRGEPLSDVSYTVQCADGSEVEGSTDGDGKLVEKDLPPGPCRVQFERESNQ